MKLRIRRTLNNRQFVAIGTIPVFILTILIVITNTPIFARNIPNSIYYGLVLGFLLSCKDLFRGISKEKVFLITLLLGYFCLQLIYKLLSISTATWAHYSTSFKFFFFLFVMILIVPYLSPKQKKVIISVTALSMIITMGDNLRLYSQYGATRFVHLFQQQRFSTNSVNTTFVGAILFLNAILFIDFFYVKANYKKVVLIIFSFFNLFFMLIIAQRMMILVLILLMYPLLIIYRKEFTRKRTIFVFLLCIILLGIVFQYRSVINFLDSIISSGRMSLRFSQIDLFLSTGDIAEAGGTLNGRTQLMLRSLETWFSSFSNFMIGAGDHRGSYNIIGNHSEIFDECARYGLVGLLISIPLTIFYLKQIKQCSGCRYNSPIMRQITVVEFIYVLRALLGSVYEAAIGVQMFVFLPVAVSLIEERHGCTIENE